MAYIRRAVPMGLAALMISGSAALADWRQEFAEIRLGTAASEVDDDTVRALEALSAYLTDTFGVPFVIQQATDYAAVTEALRAGNLEFTRMGGANYALAYRVMGEGILPLALDVSETGRGYSAMVVVRADSPYQSLEDLRAHILQVSR